MNFAYDTNRPGNFTSSTPEELSTDADLATGQAGVHAVWDRAIHLDTLVIREHAVGYGTLGRNGELGYEDKRVVVRGCHYSRALSAHAPLISYLS